MGPVVHPRPILRAFLFVALSVGGRGKVARISSRAPLLRVLGATLGNKKSVGDAPADRRWLGPSRGEIGRVLRLPLASVGVFSAGVG